MDFDIWQESECIRIGCTREQHNRLIEIASEIAATGIGGDSYSALVAVISQPSTTLLELAAQQLVAADRLPQRPAKAIRPRKYQSKKSRRLHGGG